mmetsp:Transcript_1315/g.2822  ORF Transcript_1315/g.2822 Transcript_1315/m.2822 type:complete len:368 (+) Transcript_1315:248-1351(+)
MYLPWEDLSQLRGSSPLGIAVVASIVLCILVAQNLSQLDLLSFADGRIFSSSRSRQRNTGSNDDSYQITRCPNPNCARCSRYVELNRSARRRLAWISDANNEDLARIRQAILAGPEVTDYGGSMGLTTCTKSKADHASSPVSGQRPNVLLVRGLKTRPIVTEVHQDARRLLEDMGKDIMLNEYCSAMESPSASALENDVSRGMWKVLHLLNQGSWVQCNVDLCPKTTEAVRSMRGIMNGCIFGNIFISVMYPGTFVDPHCGPTNVRHRLHFPLIVPTAPIDSEPELRVANERITWNEGETVVFDDSIVHAASYPGNESGNSSSLLINGKEGSDEQGLCRVVLIVDLWHPDLSAGEREAISDLYPAAN